MKNFITTNYKPLGQILIYSGLLLTFGLGFTLVIAGIHVICHYGSKTKL